MKYQIYMLISPCPPVLEKFYLLESSCIGLPNRLTVRFSNALMEFQYIVINFEFGNYDFQLMRVGRAFLKQNLFLHAWNARRGLLSQQSVCTIFNCMWRTFDILLLCSRILWLLGSPGNYDSPAYSMNIQAFVLSFLLFSVIWYNFVFHDLSLSSSRKYFLSDFHKNFCYPYILENSMFWVSLWLWRICARSCNVSHMFASITFHENTIIFSLRIVNICLWTFCCAMFRWFTCIADVITKFC